MKSPLPCPRRFLAGLHLILAITVLAPLAPLSAVESAERNSIKVLTIGNSFANDATAYLPDIVKAAGKEIVIFKANLGGCSFERHAGHLASALSGATTPEGNPYKNTPELNLPDKKKVSLPEALAAQKWDFVTIQQWSQQSYKPETWHPYVDQIIAAVRKFAPQAEIVIHETWAYREDHGFFKKDDGLTPLKMYEGLRDAYRQLAADTGFRMMPVGDAYHAARQTPRWAYVPDTTFDFKHATEGSLPDQTKSINVGWRWVKNEKTGKKELSLDAIHSNNYGRYIGAVVWYEVLFNTTSAPDTFAPPGVNAEDAAALRQIASATVAAERARVAVPAAK